MITASEYIRKSDLVNRLQCILDKKIKPGEDQEFKISLSAKISIKNGIGSIRSKMSARSPSEGGELIDCHFDAPGGLFDTEPDESDKLAHLNFWQDRKRDAERRYMGKCNGEEKKMAWEDLHQANEKICKHIVDHQYPLPEFTDDETIKQSDVIQQAKDDIDKMTDEASMELDQSKQEMLLEIDRRIKSLPDMGCECTTQSGQVLDANDIGDHIADMIGHGEYLTDDGEILGSDGIESDFDLADQIEIARIDAAGIIAAAATNTDPNLTDRYKAEAIAAIKKLAQLGHGYEDQNDIQLNPENIDEYMDSLTIQKNMAEFKTNTEGVKHVIESAMAN